MMVFFEKQMLIGMLMIVASVVFHVAALVYLANTLDRLTTSTRVTNARLRSIGYLSISVLFIVVVHTIEAWGWAAIYYIVGEFIEFKDSLYFSIVTATTLGYGDITLSDRWQLLATFEAMGGLILFGVTTAFLLEILRSFFEEIPESNTVDTTSNARHTR